MSTSDRWACICRFGGFGDNLIASSVLPGLKKRFDKVEVIGSDNLWGALWRNNPHIDKLTVLKDGFPAWGDGRSWQRWFVDRSKEYAFFANLSHSCEIQGVLTMAQTSYWWSDKMRRQLCAKSYLEIVHDVCDVPYDEIAPNFYPTQEERAQALETKAKMGPKVIGWVMSGTRIDKVHPHADIAVARLIKETGLPVVLLGGPGKDYELAKMIQFEVQKLNRSTDGLHLALSPDPEQPSWPPRRLMAQTQTCDIVVGPDTGPMWGVAMHDMPKILMVSHTSAENITKHWKNTTTLHADPEHVPCWPCHRLHDTQEFCTPNADRNGAACITDISVDKIVDTVKLHLQEGQNGSNQQVCNQSNAGLGSGRGLTESAGNEGNRSITWIADQRKRV